LPFYSSVTIVSEQKLPALQALAEYNENGLVKLRGSRLSDVATALLAELPNHKAALEDEYGIDRDRTKELQDAIKAFNGLKTAPARPKLTARRPAPASALSLPNWAPCFRTVSSASCASTSAATSGSTTASWLPAP
jgi:hypothetical protein